MGGFGCLGNEPRICASWNPFCSPPNGSPCSRERTLGGWHLRAAGFGSVPFGASRCRAPVPSELLPACLRPSGPPCHLPPLCVLWSHFQSQTEAGAVRWSCTYSIGPGATECCSGRGAGWEGRGCRTRSEMNIVVTPGTRSRPPKPWAERSEAEPYPTFPFVPVQGAGSTEMAENSFIQLCVRDIFLRQPVPTYENLSTCRSTGEQTEVRKSAGTRRHFTHISNSSLTLSSRFAQRYSKHLYIITYSGTQTTFGDTLSQLHR